jgi:Family of unknown function (DUF5681)
MTSANRQRLYRERQKCGLRIVPTPIDPDMIQRLVDLGYLQLEDLDDRQAIGEAAAEFMDREAYRGGAVTRDAVEHGSAHNHEPDARPSQITRSEPDMTARKRKTADKEASNGAGDVADQEAPNVERNQRGQFPKGVSGNPRGRPRETPEEFALLSKIRSLSDKAVKAIEAVLDDPDAPADAIIKASNIVFDRVLGKPRQEIDSNITQNVATPADHKPDLSDLRRRAMAAAASEVSGDGRLSGEDQPSVLQH